jgi:hypothetical protein
MTSNFMIFAMRRIQLLGLLGLSVLMRRLYIQEPSQEGLLNIEGELSV